MYMVVNAENIPVADDMEVNKATAPLSLSLSLYLYL